MRRRRLVYACVVLGGLAACWMLVVMWTGGAVWYLGGVRISSRGPRNPALVAVLSLVIAWVIAPPGQRTHAVAAECRWLLDLVARRMPRIRPPAALVAAVAAAAVVAVGVTEGAGAVGGSDSYGYVSQAHLWSMGVFRQEPVLLRPLAPDVSIEALAPLGYRPTIDGTTIAPTYSPGLPMVMAVFERVAGPNSVFWVVPLSAGVLVWVTYLLGTRLHGPLVGAMAAVLVATSTPVLVQLTTAPMSDLPAAAWWTLAFVLATVDRRVAAVGAGAAAAAAVLTRPNLVPVLVIAAAFLIARLIAARRPLREIVVRVMLFALLTVPASLAIAAIYRTFWGSVLKSGYGSLNDLFSIANIWPNMLLYPRAIASCLPVALLGPIAWFVHRDRLTTIALGSWTAVVALVYLPYPAYDSEWNLRFLLPGVPALMVLVSLAVLPLAELLIEKHAAAALLIAAAVGGLGVHTARRLLAFDMEHERRYAAIGAFIERELPERAVLLAMLHSGSANYYSGRPTIRYDLLAATRLDPLVDLLRQRGYVPYLLIDSDERAAFQAQYRGHSRLAGLDWPPLVRMSSPPVEVYSVPPQDTSRP
jgi:hypothetical protein